MESTIAASALASLIARLVVHPIDTLKTIIQNGNSASSIAKTPLGLYQGVGVTVLFSVPAMTIYLATYDNVKSRFVDRNIDSVWSHGVSAASAEALAGILFTPMEVVKQKLQVNIKASTFSIIADVFKQNGLLGFYRGYFLTECVFVPYTVTYFVTYEKLKKYCQSGVESTQQNATIPLHMYLTCSSIAATLGGIVTNPLDIIKTRVQITGKSALSVTKQLWNEGGWKSFTRGLGIRTAWIVPNMSITITLFEYLKSTL
ncbi:mitochondrial carrier domain-containing protein [Globomyces pollinis-pini]|nr:mitochondrial carrier domain-containing protein [Globomyces pollinis-pini]